MTKWFPAIATVLVLSTMLLVSWMGKAEQRQLTLEHENVLSWN